MSLKLLDDCVRSYLRSGVAISCISQCVEELVLNSIDAGAQSITVRVDVSKLFIQVVDNGTGISYDDLRLLGERYATSKCHTLTDLDDLCFHGYRGEAVSSIISCCGIVEFKTRHCLSTSTYCKIFHHGHSLGICPARTEFPSSIGTTVTVQDIFYNFPVRRKCICDVTEYDRVRRMLTSIALIHPSIAFTLRNIQTSQCLMQAKKTNSILRNFEQLFGTQLSLGLQEVSAEKNGFKVSGYISTRSHYTKSYQFIYLNKRHVKHTKLHSQVNRLLSNSLLTRKQSKQVLGSESGIQKRLTTVDAYGVYVLNIECSLSEYDITLEPAKTLVEFKRWDDVLLAMELIVIEFLVRNNLTIGISPLPENCGASDTSILHAGPPQDVTYGIRSRTAHRTHPSTSINTAPTTESTANNSNVRTGMTHLLTQHTSTVTNCIPEDNPSGNRSQASFLLLNNTTKDGHNEGIYSSAVHSLSQSSLEGADSTDKDQQHLEHVCRRRKITLDESSCQTSGKDLSQQPCNERLKIIKLDTPMRSPLHSISVASKLSRLRSSKQQSVARNTSLFNTNKLYGIQGGMENARRHENQIPNHPDAEKDNAKDQDPIEFQKEVEDVYGEFQSHSTTAQSKSKSFMTNVNNKETSGTDSYCTPSGRTVTTTYSFITPLSRDSHMTSENSPPPDEPNTYEKSRTIFFPQGDYPIIALPLATDSKYDNNDGSGYIDYRNQSVDAGYGGQMLESIGMSELASPYVEKEQDNDQENDMSSMAVSQDPLVLACDNCQNSTAMTHEINPTTGSDTREQVSSSVGANSASPICQEYTDLSNELRSPPRAASHLTYGFTPIMPRARERRGFDGQQTDEEECTEDLPDISVDVPESKWRDKSHEVSSSILSDWKNPAFSCGDMDVLNIGLSAEKSSGIKIHTVIHPYKFTNDIFSNIQILGQVDHKFIACLLQTESEIAKTTHRLLVFFDQHAVHERVRLEALIESAYCSGKIVSVDVQPPQVITLNETEKKLALIYEKQLEAIGIKLQRDGTKTFVCSMPLAFSERDLSERRKGRSTVAVELVHELVSKHLDLLCSTEGVCTTLPLTIQQVLNSQACHGAIKFGDPLTDGECAELIHSLSSCKLPFQCAHGRPSLIPILDLQLLERRFPRQTTTSAIDVRKLKILSHGQNLY